MPEISAAHNQITYSVSEISGAVKRVVEDNFGQVRVRGEISGLKAAGSGHVYLALKDEKALIDGVMWKGTAGRLSFRPADGLEVICTGKLTTYPGRSKYQLVIEHMEPAGVGALMALLEQRKKQFAAEGLFDAGRKKPLPFMPEVIGVVTSPTGAVIRDILHRLADRWPCHVLVWPVLVQGEGAAEQIAEAIAGFNSVTSGGAIPRPDLIIVARGGGSLEDLWAFNEEIVVRAVAASRIPLISAVGHETDTTLIDYVSDMRAPTPTAAAEMAAPIMAEWLLALGDYERRMGSGLLKLVQHRQERIQGMARGLPRPERLLALAMQRLDEGTMRLQAALPRLVARKGDFLRMALARLRPQALMTEMARQERDLQRMSTQMERAWRHGFTRRQERLKTLSSLLSQLDFRQVLARGFVLVRDAAGHVVGSAGQLAEGQAVTLGFYDGQVPVVVSDGASDATKALPKVRGAARQKTSSSSTQGELL